MPTEAILLAVLMYLWTLAALGFKFKVGLGELFCLIPPLAMLTLGYYLRLSGHQPAVDIGFFLTDGSFLFTYLLFALFLLLGQLKYWGKVEARRGRS